jgi:hypothetical protein
MRPLWHRFMVLGLSLLLASGMLLALRLGLRSASVAQASSPASTPLVLAEYQVWHGLPNHLIPPPYTSTEPSVISDHIRLAQAQGIGGFVVDWYGPPGGFLNDTDRDFMDRATAELMQQAGPRGFRVALMYDEGTISWTGITNTISYTNLVLNDLLYARRYLTMTAYLTMTVGITTAPAIFVFPYDTIDPYIDWSYVRNHLGIPVILLDKDPNPLDPTHDANFDGFYAWVWTPEWKPNGTAWGKDYLIWFYETMKNNSAYSNKITIGGVWPGFNDSLASWGSGRYIWRRCGQTWRDTWALTNAYNPPFVMIDTWNDFEEGTDIEYGTATAWRVLGCIFFPIVLK